MHRPPSWANRPGAGEINNRWPRPDAPNYGMDNWLDNHPNRYARWNYWGSNVRNGWRGYHYHGGWFAAGWWNGHAHVIGDWHYGYCFDRHPYSYWWTVPTYAALTNWFTWSVPSYAWSQPAYYDYGQGGNVYYEDNTMYVDGQAVGSAEDYAASAAQLATVEPPADEADAEQEDWLPLGTFAVSTSEKETEPTRIVQLAVNQQGIVSGTVYNTATDQAQTISGQIDKETQRVAMRIGESDNVVIETGLYNLTKDEVPVMVHFGADKGDYWLLVRLEAPEDAIAAE